MTTYNAAVKTDESYRSKGRQRFEVKLRKDIYYFTRRVPRGGNNDARTTSRGVICFQELAQVRQLLSRNWTLDSTEIDSTCTAYNLSLIHISEPTRPY